MPGRAEGVAPCARGPFNICHILLTYRWKINAGKYATATTLQFVSSLLCL